MVHQVARPGELPTPLPHPLPVLRLLAVGYLASLWSEVLR